MHNKLFKKINKWSRKWNAYIKNIKNSRKVEEYMNIYLPMPLLTTAPSPSRWDLAKNLLRTNLGVLKAEQIPDIEKDTDLIIKFSSKRFL